MRGKIALEEHFALEETLATCYVTTSGNFWTKTLRAAIAEIGLERVMFSVDYPFEDTVDGASWFDGAELTETERQQIGRGNASRLFGIEPRKHETTKA